MNLTPRRLRCFVAVAACLLLGLGMVIGGAIGRREPAPEGVVAAFAPADSPEGAPGTGSLEPDALETGSLGTGSLGLGSPEPAPSSENWFALDLIPSGGVEFDTGAGAPGPAASGPEATATPAPTPTLEPGFAIELVREGDRPGLTAQGPAKRVLIYHTHTYEAFEQTEQNPYQETQQWRTQDPRHNMVRVGEELASLLRGMGVEVVHDPTAFESPDFNTSYARSLDMLLQRRAMGETYDLYVDVHRDAYLASQTGPNAVSVGDNAVARLMMLVGKGEGQTTEGYEEKPQWQDNLAIAQRITDSLNSQLPGLGKDVRIKSGRFNQHIAVGCLLVEVGNNRNTLEEALAAMPYLADALVQELNGGQGTGQ